MRRARSPGLLLLLAFGCTPRLAPRDSGRRRNPAAPDASAMVVRVDPSPDAGAAAPADAPVVVPAPPPPLTLVGLTGGATLDTSLRLDRRDAGAGVGAASVGQTLRPGDALLVGAASAATVAVGAAGQITLLGNSTAEAAAHAGAALVLSVGVATVEARPLASEPVRVDTPAGRVIVGAGACTIAVADDGSTLVAAARDGVTVWPSPPAPPAQTTRLTPAQIAALRRQTPDHPVLLDVEIRELDAALRPVASRALRAGELVVFSPLGAATPTPRPLARPPDPLGGSAALRGWVETHRPNVVAIGVLSRAGAADVADVNAAITRLRSTGAALDEETRGRVAAQLSLALGRLAARSRRGRDLAVRGGDVTALVQMARFEALRDEARALTAP
jgi:hypothetical protein